MGSTPDPNGQRSLTPGGGPSRAILPKPEHMLLLRPANSVRPPEEAAAAAPSRRTRTSKPKVRTGCLTCKTRRVKCDERKPACLRCEKAKVACAGYAEPEAKRRRGRDANATSSVPGASSVTAAAARRPLAPRATTTDPSSTVYSVLPRSFVGLPKLSGRDMIYFDYFRHQVARELSGHYTSGLWFRLALGEAIQDDCVRHCVLAIGALTQTMSSLPFHESLPEDPTDEHHLAAMRHRARAIASFKNTLQVKPVSYCPRSFMITTLLLVLLETIQGHMKAADVLMNNGLHLLKDHISFFSDGSRSPEYRGASISSMVTTTNTATPPTTTTSVIDDDMREMEHVLPCLSVMSHLAYQYEPERRVFPRLTSDPDFLFPRFGQDPISSMFTNWGRFFTSALVFTGEAVYACLEGMPIHKLVRLIPRQHTFVSHLQTWRSVIADYAADPRLDDVVARKALRIVQIHWLMLRANVATALDHTEVACDAFEAEYRALLHLCLDFMRDELTSRTPASVILGEGLTMPLTLVIYSCRNHDLRMAAFNAVRLLPWSRDPEGGRDLMIGLMGAMLLEEQGRLPNGFIPPEDRWFALGGEWDGPRRYSEGSILYWRQCLQKDGTPVFKKLTADTSRWPDICEVAGCTKDHTEMLPFPRAVLEGGVLTRRHGQARP